MILKLIKEIYRHSFKSDMFISGGGSASGYVIERSLRFSAASSQYLSRTPSVAGNQRTWTWSCWVKRGTLNSVQAIFDASIAGVWFNLIGFTANNNLTWFNGDGAGDPELITTAVYRDTSAWLHIVFVYDSTNATASERTRLFVNGTRITSFTTQVNASLNEQTTINQATAHHIGRRASIGDGQFDGYIADPRFIGGQALDASSFGEINPLTGEWVAKKYAGTYGTNGFYLDFLDGTSTTTLGDDKSGNNNDWTLTNFTRSAGANDCWMLDVPTGNGSASAVQPSGNYCVLNPLDKITTATLVGANLLTTSAASQAVIGSIGMTAGFYYWELSFSAATTVQRIGVYGTTTHTVDITATTNSIGVRFNRDTGALDYTTDGTTYTSIATGLTTGTYFPYAASTTNSKVIYWNFGQRSFSYTPPAGFKALCTANLTSTDVIESGSFTGNASADGPFIWCNGTPETLAINGNAVTWGTHADRLSNGFKLRTSSSSYNSSGTNTWTATILSPESKSAFKHQNAKGN